MANTPAVASAAPGDSGKGSSAGGSSQSSDPPSGKKGASSPDSSSTSDAPKPRRHPPTQADETTVTPKKSGSDLHKGDASSSVAKTSLKVAALTATAVGQPSRTPAAPAPAPAELTMLGLARRESTATTSAATATTSAATATTSAATATTSAADPDFITSTHGFFGLFSVTSAADPDDNHYVAFVLRTPLFTNVLTSGTNPEDSLGLGASSIGVAGHTVNTLMSPFLDFSIAIPVEDPFAVLFTSLVRAGF
ncbi:hypothetical protein [Mycobacterium sp. JS623]|uniref:hypothetical protein n=1 Tax=Mycobacterium sp. JS623 TaxID=212767 RepID=UPI0002FDDDD9|nr:hypothetical protein [Mycobacterium sp. JS623]